MKDNCTHAKSLKRFKRVSSIAIGLLAALLITGLYAATGVLL